MGVMRTSLWPGLVSALKYNLNRQQSRVRLFETGLRFVSEDATVAKLIQTPMVAGVVYGGLNDESWHGKAQNVDFYDIKADVEALIALTGQADTFSFVAGKHSALHPGQTAEIRKNGEKVGYVGALHPQLQQQLGLSGATFVFEIEQSALLEAKIPAFKPLSKFPEVRRDIAVIVDQSVAVTDLQNAAKAAAGTYLEELKVFDVYVGKGIDSQRKSVALGLTFQHPSRTLTEDEINTSMDVVVKALEDAFNASLR
jgi:phenylalanyl-tRNA synthetase beta chain